MKIVFDLGGSLLNPKGFPEMDFVKKFCDFVLELYNKKHEIVIVTGGGGLAKKYIDALRRYKPPREFLDTLGIRATRMNAMILIGALGDYAYRNPINNIEDFELALSSKKIVVMGGTVPKQTTDAVSIAAGEFMAADLIVVATDVKGIFSSDPDVHRKAKLRERMKPKDLLQLVRDSEFTPGHSSVIDPVAAHLLVHAKIKTIVLDGKNIENMKNAVEGKNFVGTVIA
jgi:uridylate kinase